MPGCYDSDPQKGLRNPVYDIIPRNLRYNNSICRDLTEFEYEAELDQYCCQSERYCCPTSLKRCPERSVDWPYFALLDPNGAEFTALSMWQPINRTEHPLPKAALFGFITV